MTDFRTHASTIAGDLSEVTRELLGRLQDALTDRALELAVGATPQGGGRDKHPGQMRAAWTKQAPAGARSASSRLQPSKVRNAAPGGHSLVIDMGRRRSTNAYRVRGKKTTYVVKAGRMLGSPRAPFGVKRPVLRQLSAEQESIFAAASADVDNRKAR